MIKKHLVTISWMVSCPILQMVAVLGGSLAAAAAAGLAGCDDSGPTPIET